MSFCWRLFVPPASKITIPAEINPVARPEIDPEFLDPCPNTLHVGKVAKLYTGQRNRNLGCSLSIEALKPVPVRTVSSCIEVFKDLHRKMVPYALPINNVKKRRTGARRSVSIQCVGLIRETGKIHRMPD
jgi:hypothetical protein